MAANLNVFKTSKKGCILSKSNFSFAKVHWVRYRIRKKNKNFDDMGTLKVGRDTEFRTSRSREFQPVMADGKKDF